MSPTYPNIPAHLCVRYILINLPRDANIHTPKQRRFYYVNQLSCHRAERKRLVKTIASYTGCDAKYLGVPSCAYRVDCFTIDREGALSFDDSIDTEMVGELLDLLRKEGFEAEPGDMTISVPVEFDRHKTYDKLTALISSKQTLIKKALGVDELPVELTDKGFDFAWFSANATPAEQTAYRRKTYRLADYKSGALSPYATSL